MSVVVKPSDVFKNDDIAKIIGYGNASNGCKKCKKYKNHSCMGMCNICFDFEKDSKGEKK